MTEKKKICFYSILSSGHLNLCASIGSVLLNRHSDKIEIYFIVDKQWHGRISKIDPRFKFGIFEIEDKKLENHMTETVQKLEASLQMKPLKKLVYLWRMTKGDRSIIEVDEKSEKEILKIKPDFLICDQMWHIPTLIRCGIPYAFLCSCNPLLFGLDGFPIIGSGASANDKKAIENFQKEFAPYKNQMKESLYELMRLRNVEPENLTVRIDQILSDHFCLYAFPVEIDYYTEELKEKYKLLQLDTPLYPERIPKAFELPEEFAKLPGKIVYVSLGSIVSLYTHLLQRFCDILEKLPYKYIVSKGGKGDSLKFPSNKFIGENYVNQLAVLQVCDAMIAHGGNNTLGECFYFGVPCIILPIMGDQINNAVRIEETGFGFYLDVINYTDAELEDRLSKIMNDEQLRLRWRKASERIQKEKRIFTVADKIVDYVRKL